MNPFRRYLAPLSERQQTIASGIGATAGLALAQVVELVLGAPAGTAAFLYVTIPVAFCVTLLAGAGFRWSARLQSRPLHNASVR